MTADLRPIEARIADRYGTLSPQERRAADALLSHLDDLAIYRAAELAALAGVSKATMSRLFRRLDYDDFTQVRDQLRALRNTGVPVTADAAPSIAAHLDAEVEQLSRALVIGEDAIDRAADLLAAARSIVVVGLRNSYPVALHLRQQVGQARPGITVAPSPGQSLSDELIGLGGEDVVVIVAFRRRPSQVRAAVELSLSRGVPVVLLADPSATGLARGVSAWIECGVSTRGAFDSYAAAMSTVAVVADRVRERIGASAGARATAINAAYRALSETEG